MTGIKVDIDVNAAKQASAELKKSLTDLGHSATKNETEFHRLENRLRGGMEANAAQSHVEKLKKSLNLTRIETARLQTQIGDLGGAMKTLTSGAGKAAKNIALVGAAATVAFGALAIKAKNSFKDFETALVDMGRVTKRSQKEIRAGIMGMAPALGNATDLMKGYYQTISAGITDPVKSLNFLTTAAKASKAAHVDQADTVKALSKVMEGYGGAIKTATEAADLLFAIEKAGQTSFSELVPVIGDLAAMSHLAGVSQDEMGTAMGVLTKTSGSTSEAATKYKAIIMGLYKPQTAMKKIIDSTTYSSGVAMVKQLGFAKAIQKVQKEAKKAGAELGDLFGSSEATIGIAAIGSRNFAAFAESLGIVEKKTGGLNDAYKEWHKTMEATEEVFYNTIGKFSTELGKKLAPGMKRGMEEFTDYLEDHKDEIISSFEQIGTSVEAVVGLIFQMSTKFGAFTKIVASEGAAAGLAATGAISWLDYFTMSFDEMATVVDQFDKLSKASPNMLYKEWSDQIADLTNEYDVLGEEIRIFGALFTPESQAKLVGQREEIKKQIDALRDLLVVKKDIKDAEEQIKEPKGKQITKDPDALKDARLKKEEDARLKALKDFSKKYEKQTQKQMDSTFDRKIELMQQELDRYAVTEGKKADIVKFNQDKINKLIDDHLHKALAAIQKKVDVKEKALKKEATFQANFDDMYEGSTLSKFDLERKKIKEIFDLYDGKVKDQLKLDEWYKIEKEKINDEEITNAEQAQEKIQEMRYNMIKDLGESDTSSYFDEQKKAIEDYTQTYIDLTDDIVTAEAWKTQQIQELNAKAMTMDIENREKAFAEISSNLSSIANLYEEGSKQQEAATIAANVAHAAEMAMMVEKNIMIATGAVLNQAAGGDPYTAFARMAAMTAAVAGILSIADIDFSGGGSGSAQMQKIGLVNGTGTVLGDPTALSASVGNSMGFLEDIGANQYSTLVDIYYEMTDLNNNINGLATAVVRQYGEFSAESFGVLEGSEIGSIEEFSGGGLSNFANIMTLDLYGAFDDLVDKITFGLSSSIDNFISSAIGSVFGGGTEKTLIGAGFLIDPWSAAMQEDVTAQTYQDVKKRKHGGVFGHSSTKYYTLFQDVDEDITRYFTNILDSFVELSLTFADELGVSTEEAVMNYTFEIDKINLKDLTGEEINETLSNVFSEVGDNMIDALFGEMVKQYQEIDEGLLEAIIRIVSEKKVVQESFEKLGIAFDVTRAEAIDFSLKIIDLAGDVEEFQRSVESFYESFYTSVERQTTFKNLATTSIQYTEPDMVFPETKELFKDLITGIDVTAESGRELYTILMSLVDGANEYYEYLEEIADFNTSIQNIIDENTLSDYELSLKSLDEWYAEQRKTADDLGISLDNLNITYGLQLDAINTVIADFNTSIQDIIDENTLSDYELSLKSLNEWYAEQTISANELGISLDNLNIAYGLQLDAIDQAELDRLAAIDQQQLKLDIRIMELEGHTIEALAESRKIELNALNETLRASQERIWLLEDEAVASKEAAAALEEAAEAELKRVDSIESIIDGIDYILATSGMTDYEKSVYDITKQQDEWISQLNELEGSQSDLSKVAKWATLSINDLATSIFLLSEHDTTWAGIGNAISKAIGKELSASDILKEAGFDPAQLPEITNYLTDLQVNPDESILNLMFDRLNELYNSDDLKLGEVESISSILVAAFEETANAADELAQAIIDAANATWSAYADQYNQIQDLFHNSQSSWNSLLDSMLETRDTTTLFDITGDNVNVALRPQVLDVLTPPAIEIEPERIEYSFSGDAQEIELPLPTFSTTEEQYRFAIEGNEFATLYNKNETLDTATWPWKGTFKDLDELYGKYANEYDSLYRMKMTTGENLDSIVPKMSISDFKAIFEDITIIPAITEPAWDSGEAVTHIFGDFTLTDLMNEFAGGRTGQDWNVDEAETSLKNLNTILRNLAEAGDITSDTFGILMNEAISRFENYKEKIKALTSGIIQYNQALDADYLPSGDLLIASMGITNDGLENVSASFDLLNSSIESDEDGILDLSTALTGFSTAYTELNSLLIDGTISASEYNSLLSEATGLYNQSTNAIESAKSEYESFIDSIGNYLGSLVDDTEIINLSYERAKREYQKTLSAANAGDEDARNNLTGVAGSFLDASKKYSSSQYEYQKDIGIVRRSLVDAEDLAEDQVDVIDELLDQAIIQIESLEDLQALIDDSNSELYDNSILLTGINQTLIDQHTEEALQMSELFETFLGGDSTLAQLLGELIYFKQIQDAKSVIEPQQQKFIEEQYNDLDNKRWFVSDSGAIFGIEHDNFDELRENNPYKKFQEISNYAEYLATGELSGNLLGATYDPLETLPTAEIAPDTMVNKALESLETIGWRGALAMDITVFGLNSYLSAQGLPELTGYAEGGISTGPTSGHMELLHGTEAIIPLNNGYIPVQIQGNNTELVAEIKQLRKELLTANIEIIKTNKKIHKILDRVNQGGTTLRTMEIAA